MAFSPSATGSAAWSKTPSAADALRQAIELAEAAEELGVDGAYVRVHHYMRQLAAPFPLLAAIAARTSRIEIGTGVIDLRYENPLYMAEEAAAADLISGGRLQLGMSRGSPEPALRGAETFGYFADGASDAEIARRKVTQFREAIAGARIADPNPDFPLALPVASGKLPLEPRSPGLEHRIWWGTATRESARWTGLQGMNMMSSTLMLEDTGVSFDRLQAEQIEAFREGWNAGGWEHQPRVSVSRSVIPIVTAEDDRLFGRRARENRDTLGYLDGAFARFGRSYSGPPDEIAAELARDEAVQAADTLLVTLPNQLGVEYNAHMLETIVREIAPALSWRPAPVAPGPP